MKNSESSTKLSIFLLVVLLVVTNVYWFNNSRNDSSSIESLQKEHNKIKGDALSLESELEKVSSDYDELYKEKNGQANEKLTNAARDLFSLVFSYDTGEKEDNVTNRKKKASDLTEQAALNALFPSDDDKWTATVRTVSELDGDPEVYFVPSDQPKTEALILVGFSNSIAGSEKIKGTNMYKVSFDQTSQKFVSIKNLGILNIP